MKLHDCPRHVRWSATLLAACLVTAGPLSKPTSAQEWPSRNITVIVPLGAGSATDVVTRLVMDELGKQLGQTIVVENRVGAGGTIGASMVAKSAPDGYTILAYGALAIANSLYTKLPYDTLNDFIPIIGLGLQPLAVVVNPSKNYKTLGGLIAAAKAKPGALNYGSAGIGSASHFAAERLRISAGFDAQHIAFKAASDAVTEVVAGRLDFTVQPLVVTLPLIRDGQIIPLAVSADKRAALMPEVPTTIEAGLSAESVYPFYSALYLPAKTPREIAEKIHRETAKALLTPTVQARFATLGVEPMPMTMEQFGKFVRSDIEATTALVKAANIPRQ
jgi:tripartite-type tricarboxylate transporter receptor subunit TctC